MIKSAKQSERASVLIVAVGVLVALTLMAVTFATLMRLDMAASTNMDEVLTCRLIARGGLEYAQYILWRDMYGTDEIPYSADEGAQTTGAAPYVIDWNDENFDSYWEEWMPGGGLFSVFGTGEYARGKGRPEPGYNDVDNDGLQDSGSSIPGYTGYMGYDSKWLDWPIDLPNGRKAQVAILIKDFGAGRLNINYSCNNDGATTNTYAYTNPRYATAITGTAFGGIPNLDPLALKQIVRARYGGDDLANDSSGATTKSWAFLPYNPQGDSPSTQDNPFGAFDAAELIWGTQAKSRLEAAMAAGGYPCTSLTAQCLTPWSADTMWPPYDRATRYRKSVNTLTASQLQALGNTAVYSWWDDAKICDGDNTKWAQFVVNLVDYRDADANITELSVGGSTYYGIEPHPYITELYSASGGVGTASNEVYRIELFNPFGHAITLSDFALSFEFKFNFEQDAATTTDSPIARTLQGTVDLSSLTTPIPPGGYLTLGNNKTNGDVGDAADVNLDGKVTWTITPPRSSVIDTGSELMTSRTDFTGNKFKLYFDDCQVVLKRSSAPQVVVDQAKQGIVPDQTHTYGGALADPTWTTNVSMQRERYNIEETANWKNEGTNDSMGDEYPNAQPTIKLSVAQGEIYTLGQFADIMIWPGYDLLKSYTENAADSSDSSWGDACKEADKPNPDQAKLNAVFFNPWKAMSLWPFFETFTTEDPRGNGRDDDGDGVKDSNDDLGISTDVGGPEIQLPGRININTAPANVLAHLPAYWNDSTETRETLGELMGGAVTLAAAIVAERESQGPFRGISDLRLVSGMNQMGSDGQDNDRDGIRDDEREMALIIRNIANLITVRSNVFAVYVTARIIDDPATDGRDNDGDGTIDEAGEAAKDLNHDGIDNDGDGAVDEKDEADDCYDVVARQRLVAVVDRSTKPITVRFFRWANDSWETWQQ